MSTATSPQLSIITINLNNAEGLKKTIISVLNQSWKEFEFIIIDGGSTDDSKIILEQYKEDISSSLSEKDDGVYNAMNKGISRAKGEYLLFLNSGDYLYSEKVLEEFFSEERNEDIIYANIVVDNGSKSRIKRYPASLTFGYFLKESLPHPASLIKGELFNKTGLYNEQNKVVSDWEFFINAICLHQVSYKYLDFTATVFHLDGMSSKEENAVLLNNERNAILHKYYRLFLPDYRIAEENRIALKSYGKSKLHSLVNSIMNTSVYKFLVRFA